ALSADDLEFWAVHAPETRIVNEYGPTETVVGCCVYELAAGDLPAGSVVPIGKPIANTAVYVLDDSLCLVAPGVTGELYIAGARCPPPSCPATGWPRPPSSPGRTGRATAAWWPTWWPPRGRRCRPITSAAGFGAPCPTTWSPPPSWCSSPCPSPPTASWTAGRCRLPRSPPEVAGRPAPPPSSCSATSSPRCSGSPRSASTTTSSRSGATR